jgi:hypothetical protein
MAITTEEFEKQLGDLLSRMETWRRCQWCGCNDQQRRTAANSKLCDSCKEWNRRERKAEEWIRQHPDSLGTEQGMHIEYNVEYAALCREEGQICSWKWPITALQLEGELREISKRFCGEDVFGPMILYLQQFSPTQRRLLMFLFEELTKVWVRNRRRQFAIDRVFEKHRLNNRDLIWVKLSMNERLLNTTKTCLALSKRFVSWPLAGPRCSLGAQARAVFLAL